MSTGMLLGVVLLLLAAKRTPVASIPGPVKVRTASRAGAVGAEARGVPNPTHAPDAQPLPNYPDDPEPMVWKKIGPNVHEFLLVSGFEVAIEFDFRFSGHSFNGQDVDRTTAAGVEAALRRQIEWKALTVYDYEHPPKEAQWPAPLDAASPGQFYALGLPVGQKVLKRPIQIVNVWYRRGQLA